MITRKEIIELGWHPLTGPRKLSMNMQRTYKGKIGEDFYSLGYTGETYILYNETRKRIVCEGNITKSELGYIMNVLNTQYIDIIKKYNLELFYKNPHLFDPNIERGEFHSWGFKGECGFTEEEIKRDWVKGEYPGGIYDIDIDENHKLTANIDLNTCMVIYKKYENKELKLYGQACLRDGEAHYVYQS